MVQLDYSKADFLRNLPLFSKLTAGEVSDILRATEPVVIAAGERLFAEGDPPWGLYVIERGELEVSIHTHNGRDLVLAHLGNGSVVGEMALIAGGPRSATVEATSQCQGLYLSRERFDELRKNGAAPAYKIILQLATLLEERRRELAARIRHVQEDPNLAPMLREQATKELIARVRKA